MRAPPPSSDGSRMSRRSVLAGLGAAGTLAATGTLAAAGSLAGCGAEHPAGGAAGAGARRAAAPTAAAVAAANHLAGVRAGDGSAVIAARPVGGRAVDILIEAHALAATAPVRVLVPDGYSPAGGRRWPVLYLLHGADTGYAAWTTFSDVEAVTAGAGAMVVMPEGGRWGWYTDWWNRGHGRVPAWETFHLAEVAQILGRGVRAEGQRAVAGFSMGGMGALAYAGRHPGTWAAAAAFSGQLDLTYDRPTPLGRTQPAFLMRTAASFGLDPLGCWGDPVAEADLWSAHNPRDLVGRLGRDVHLYVASGDGRPGPLDPKGVSVHSVEADYEASLYATSRSFLDAARRVGVRVTTDLYGPGTHTWPYWQRDLHRAWPMLHRALGV